MAGTIRILDPDFAKVLGEPNPTIEQVVDLTSNLESALRETGLTFTQLCESIKSKYLGDILQDLIGHTPQSAAEKMLMQQQLHNQ